MMATFDASSKIWYGQKVDRTAENALTFREHILEGLRRSPNKTFQISDDEDTNFSFQETELLTIRAAQNLKKLGFEQGEVISLVMPNSSYAAPFVYGCLLSGIAVNPVHFGNELSAIEIKKAFGVSKPKAIVLERPLENFSADLEMIMQVVDEMGLGCKIFTVGTDKNFNNSKILSFSEMFTETEGENEFELDKNDGVTDASITFIIPSSGSTGPPKSIALDGKYCIFMKYAWTDFEDSVIFVYSNLSGIAGVSALFFALFFNRTRIVSKELFSPKQFGRIVRSYKVTHGLCLVEQASNLLQSSCFNPEDFDTMKQLLVGGERVPSTLRELLKSQFKPGCFGVAIGATEINMMARYNREAGTSGIKGNVVGNLINNAMGKIIDFNSKSQLGPNEVGEIYLKTESMFTGYYQNEELTAKAHDADGWYKMGDVAYFDNDCNLYVLGRVNNLMIIDGKTVHLSQIESVFESIEGVKGACALDVVPGKVLAVLITIHPNSSVNDVTLKEVANEELPNIELKGGIHIVDEIPRTSSVGNKILRFDANKLALQLINIKKIQL